MALSRIRQEDEEVWIDLLISPVWPKIWEAEG
ncbi:hypothetical protein ES703_99138 [subsurface metagenome]